MRRYIGVDLHKNTFTVCYLSREGSELKSFKVSKKEIKAFKQTLTKNDEVGVESTGNTGYFAREIKDSVKAVRIINPTQFKIISQKVKGWTKEGEKKDRFKTVYFPKALQEHLKEHLKTKTRRREPLLPESPLICLKKRRQAWCTSGPEGL